LAAEVKTTICALIPEKRRFLQNIELFKLILDVVAIRKKLPWDFF
jgi:hypothetical protein